ncbi:hypothetical protein E7X38_28995 [Streptomyces sp. Akac8]|nr:hypothetical protein E7X38_28995 [Streptomyces sp. Akac8]
MTASPAADGAAPAAGAPATVRPATAAAASIPMVLLRMDISSPSLSSPNAPKAAHHPRPGKECRGRSAYPIPDIWGGRTTGGLSPSGSPSAPPRPACRTSPAAAPH